MNKPLSLRLKHYVRESLAEHARGLKAALANAENIWNDCRSMSQFNQSSQFKAGEINAFSGELTAFAQRISQSIGSTEKYLKSIETLESKGINLLYYNNNFYRPSQAAFISD
jgi:hypothetical protein